MVTLSLTSLWEAKEFDRMILNSKDVQIWIQVFDFWGADISCLGGKLVFKLRIMYLYDKLYILGNYCASLREELKSHTTV